MKRAIAAALLMTTAACAPPKPDVGASVGAGGASARAGVDAGRVNAGVSTHGAYASADVIDAENVNVRVGTNGPSASVRVGQSPVRVGWGLGGLRVGF